MTNPHDIIIRPIVTEQSMAQMAENKYTFVVSKQANKTEIKKAVEETKGEYLLHGYQGGRQLVYNESARRM